MDIKLNDEQRGRVEVVRELAIKLLVAADREDIPAFEEARADLTLIFETIDLEAISTIRLNEEGNW